MNKKNYSTEQTNYRYYINTINIDIYVYSQKITKKMLKFKFTSIQNNI